MLPLLLVLPLVRYVDASATGANDGSSWTDAHTDLVTALDAAAVGDQVWVAAGTYRPSSTGDRSATFLVPDGVALYGGFAGTEASLAERAGLFEATILSGDLLADDGPGFANVSDNSYHVVTLDPIVVTVDGFSIAGGNATNDEGGGLYAPLLGTKSIVNCSFRANRADRRGGALFLVPGDGALVRDCVFLGNHADQEGGAALMIPIDVPPRFESCLFLGNSSSGGGGAIFGWAYVVNCEFSGNSADGSLAGGGAIHGYVSLLNCTLSRNTALGSAQGGGGILAMGTVALWNSVLWGNVDDDGTGEQSQVRAPIRLEVRSSCVQGWTGQTGTGQNVLFGDPRFLDADGADDVAGTIDDDLRLELGSSCVDTAGDPPGHLPLPLTDVAGQRRYKDSLSCDGAGVLDVGARERQSIDGTTSYCAQPPTSLGVPAELSAPCLVGAAGGEVLFRVGPVSSSTGFLFFGSQTASATFGVDMFCIGGQVHRLPALSRVGTSLALDLDLDDQRAAALVPGSTWHFQALFRDAGTLRLSDATTITFRD